jgi:hypothetical protein
VDGLDWAMIKVDGLLNYASHLYSKGFKREPPCGGVLACSGNELIYGTGSGIACSIQMRGASNSRIVWSVSFDKTPGSFALS